MQETEFPVLANICISTGISFNFANINGGHSGIMDKPIGIVLLMVSSFNFFLNYITCLH